MDTKALVDLIYVMTFVMGGLFLGVAPLVLSWMLAPKRTRQVDQRMRQAIECGIPPIGDTWIRYGVVYYLYALIFIAFSVDVLFLLPVVLIYRDSAGWLPMIEITLFIAILSLVIVYAWKKGVFTWKSRISSQKD